MLKKKNSDFDQYLDEIKGNTIKENNKTVYSNNILNELKPYFL